MIILYSVCCIHDNKGMLPLIKALFFFCEFLDRYFSSHSHMYLQNYHSTEISWLLSLAWRGKKYWKRTLLSKVLMMLEFWKTKNTQLNSLYIGFYIENWLSLLNGSDPSFSQPHLRSHKMSTRLNISTKAKTETKRSFTKSPTGFNFLIINWF